MDFFNFILTPKNNQGSQDIPGHIDDKRLTRMQKRRRNKPDLDKEQRSKKKMKFEEMKIEIEALKDELERLSKITEILFYLFYFEKFKERAKTYYLRYINFWREKTSGLRNYQQQFLKFRFDEISYSQTETEIPLPVTFLKIKDYFLKSR